jgi:hypothetical protein
VFDELLGGVRMAIPAKSIVLLSGVPATGKSTFGRYLAREHGFAHYDLENHPLGWPHPELRSEWERSRPDFIRELRARHDRVALDWGFPVHCLSMVREMQAEGVHLVWFDGDATRAREVFVRRAGISLACFDKQMNDIRAVRYPESLAAVVFPVSLPLESSWTPRRSSA